MGKIVVKRLTVLVSPIQHNLKLFTKRIKTNIFYLVENLHLKKRIYIILVLRGIVTTSFSIKINYENC